MIIGALYTWCRDLLVQFQKWLKSIKAHRDEVKPTGQDLPQPTVEKRATSCVFDFVDKNVEHEGKSNCKELDHKRTKQSSSPKGTDLEHTSKDTHSLCSATLWQAEKVEVEVELRDAILDLDEGQLLNKRHYDMQDFLEFRDESAASWNVACLDAMDEALHKLVASKDECVAARKVKMVSEEKYVAIDKRISEATTLENLAFSDTSLPKLPQFVLLEIMSFLHDDRASLQALFVSCKTLNLPRDSIKTYIRKNILDSDNGDIHCCICTVPVAYPYKLVDCQHVACGRCAWTASHHCGSSCKTKIRSRPFRLGPEANKIADTNAFWILSPNANSFRIAKNEARIHGGTAGFFGKKGRQNTLDPFDGKGYHADFDDVLTLHLSDLESIPRGRKLWITLCPATCNYSGFPEKWGRATKIMRYLERTSFLQRLDEDDIVLIEEEMTEEEIYSKPRPDRYEVRLVGWEKRK
jgi:hypothetical protein